MEFENSLAAFRRAVQDGADAVELDVHATADGEIVVHHDDTIAGQPIASLPAATVRRHLLPNGEPIPTLDQTLDVIGPRLTVFVEVKGLSSGDDDSLLAVIAAGPAPDNCQVHSFDHRIVKRLRALRPALRTGILSCGFPVDPLRQVTDAGAVALWMEQSLIDDALVGAVHEGKARVYAWTVDDPRRLRALAGMGVDGLCTNHPARAREALA